MLSAKTGLKVLHYALEKVSKDSFVFFVLCFNLSSFIRLQDFKEVGFFNFCFFEQGVLFGVLSVCVGFLWVWVVFFLPKQTPKFCTRKDLQVSFTSHTGKVF